MPGTYVLVYTSDGTKHAYKVLWSGGGIHNAGVWYEAMTISNIAESGDINDMHVEGYAIIIASIGTRHVEKNYYAGFTSNWHVRVEKGTYSLPDVDNDMFSISTKTNNKQ